MKSHIQHVKFLLNKGRLFRFLFGIVLTMIFALAGYGLNEVPGFHYVGPLACAMFLAILYRQLWGYPEAVRSGIEFSAKKILRGAIVLYGLKLNMDDVIHHGLGLLLRDVGTVVFAILFTVWLAKRFKADASLSLLLGIGTGVCGAAAIAAVSPILKSDDEDTAIGVGLIALVGTVFAILFTVLRPWLPLTDIQYGIWSGISLHEIAHVALAAAPAGQDALAMALLAKLGRVFLLIPLSFILMYWMKRTGKMRTGTKVESPWFLIGFIAASILGSYVFGKYIVVSPKLMNELSQLTTFMLTMAMVGMGLNVSFKTLREKAMLPLLVLSITSIILVGLTFVTV
ncbi:YeiH family protein [Paenibacillus ottowii]|uniref:Sulfate exporter family transporter n=1 Tax=Paenibacillus ottowii TaxID=2315729 RepID=A0ABY3AX82_9BACL|nr:putative sulfate exporter family transporter [Paenibacillus ottowii]NEU26371.1 putative sulfate exporter family transporter [Paenibacillus polymyxa]TQR92339.1 putative sulfate exporter family transporter [Paenibacillus ottowii]